MIMTVPAARQILRARQSLSPPKLPSSKLFDLIPSSFNHTHPQRMSCTSFPSWTTSPKNHVATVHVRDEQFLSETQTIALVFHGFGGLPHSQGDKIDSEAVRCHGYNWYLSLYPGGTAGQSSAGQVGVFLCRKLSNNGGRERDANVIVSCKLYFPTGKSLQRHCNKQNFAAHSSLVWGWDDFIARKDVLDSEYLVNGALTIAAEIQLWSKRPQSWVPQTQRFQKDMLQVLESQRFADVTFVVQGKKFPVHRNIIAARAPALAEICQDVAANTEIDIGSENIDPTSFEILLRFVYGNALPHSDDLEDKAHSLLYTADYCGCTDLKLAAESVLVESVDASTTAELLMLADAKSCALLHEVATDFFVANPSAVMASPGWDKLYESKKLLQELLRATYSGKRDPGEEEAADHMTVDALRHKLRERGMEVDGSRQTLEKRLMGVETSVE